MTTSNKELHVVFGTGPAGRTLVDELLARGHRVRAVNLSGEADVPDPVELVAADVTDTAAMRTLSDGATAIYHCAHAPYERWDELLPLMQNGFLAGATHSGARLVIADTLYMYGPTNGIPMTETTPHGASSHKGKLRAELADRYLDAHRRGDAKVAIGRSADYYGPRVLNSALGATVFIPALQGKPAMAFGDIDLPHAYSYIRDVAATLATLGSREEALGHVWHVPTTSDHTTREIHHLLAEQLGHPVTADVLPAATDQAWGPLDETFMREYGELFYQYLEPQIVDCSAVHKAFGLQPTPIDQALRDTVTWYRELS